MTLETWQERQKEWKRILFEAGVSQIDFANRFDFSKTQVNEWLSGKYRPNSEGESRMIEALNTIKTEAK